MILKTLVETVEKMDTVMDAREKNENGLGLARALKNIRSDNPDIKKPLLSWDAIKNLGELKLLTRASYFFLLFVPLLAGLWPHILRPLGFNNELPLTWALSFIAALLVTIAHLIYESSAPSLIKKFSEDSFIVLELDLIGKVAGDPRALRKSLVKDNLNQVTNAYKEYVELSKSNWAFRWISACFYLLGILTILWIIYIQASIVLEATDWPWKDLVDPK